MTDAGRERARPEPISIQRFLLARGHRPEEVVNGESLLDLLWAFWVDDDNYRQDKTKWEKELE